MVRVPLRLGQESFTEGRISDKNAKKLSKLMKAFKHLMNVFEVSTYRACATSAMRDAENAKEIVRDIKKDTDIRIEIIGGQEEANIIYESHIADNLDHELNYAYVDVGGGSTEVSLISGGKLVRSQSYNIGTVRLLNQKVARQEYDRLHADMRALQEKYKISGIIGSGGNIIKLNKLAKPTNGKLQLEELEAVYTELRQYSVDELISTFSLKSDRADVITHAATIYIDIAKNIGCKEFIVPTIGLSDGIIHMLFLKWKEKNENSNTDLWY